MQRFPFEAPVAKDADNKADPAGDRSGTPDASLLSEEPLNVEEIPALIGRKLNPKFASRMIRRIGKR